MSGPDPLPDPPTGLPNALYAQLFSDPTLASLFTAEAEIAAMIRVEVALARVQAAAGVIPSEAAEAIAATGATFRPDIAALAATTSQNGAVVPGFLAAFRAAIPDAAAAQFLHWGATSQDIIDTALVLRLKDSLAQIEDRILHLLAVLAPLAEAHADTAMTGRTYGQTAAPTTFGAVLASWGAPFLRHLDRSAALRPRVLVVSLSGAAGTGAVLGPDPAQLRADLARALELGDPGQSWHSTRDGIVEFGHWLTLVAGSAAKMARDVERLCQSPLAELRLAGAGGSSTMPQKQNPVWAAAVIALSHQATGLAAGLTTALEHAEQRDGAAWFTEWLTLPPLILGAGRAVTLAGDLAKALVPQPDRMADNLAADGGLILAEAYSFALAARMPRAEAQRHIKTLCEEVRATGTPLTALMARDFPDLALPADATRATGLAGDEARAFAAAVQARLE